MFKPTTNILTIPFSALLLLISVTAMGQDFRFKRAQTDLSGVFLQLAASLEHYGSPEPYLRHMKKEHERIEAKYFAKHGRKQESYCPPYMTDQYIDKLAANWNKLSPKLGLDNLTRRCARHARLAILGNDGKGTILITTFNQHQSRVFKEMAGKTKRQTGFDELRKLVEPRLKTGIIPIADLAAAETKLTKSEKSFYQRLLSKSHFTRADFKDLDRFYKTIFDKLSNSGKSEISYRTWQGTRRKQGDQSRKQHRRDVIDNAAAFKKLFDDLSRGLDKAYSSKDSEKINSFVIGAFIEVGRMAHSELEVGIMEWAIDGK